MLEQELPNCKAASLVVSWFGDDLRAGSCLLKPKVEQKLADGQNMPWSVSGLTRQTAEEIAKVDDRPIYGGTPSDASVIEAIQAMNNAGASVMFYPFILMEQMEGNMLADPYSDQESQPALPWRGRITTQKAPGVSGTTDKTAAAVAEVDAFFGSATAADFTVSGQSVVYTGPEEWSMSRFILHYAALCQAAGGVDAFCIATEMRGLTQIRGENHRFPAVERLRALASEVRVLLGAATKISYAADWSEYFGYQPVDAPGDRYFHLDPLWMDENIDFVGIDNYMPLSDCGMALITPMRLLVRFTIWTTLKATLRVERAMIGITIRLMPAMRRYGHPLPMTQRPSHGCGDTRISGVGGPCCTMNVSMASEPLSQPFGIQKRNPFGSQSLDARLSTRERTNQILSSMPDLLKVSCHTSPMVPVMI